MSEAGRYVVRCRADHPRKAGQRCWQILATSPRPLEYIDLIRHVNAAPNDDHYHAYHCSRKGCGAVSLYREAKQEVAA